MYQRRLIPLAFGALVLENKLQYHRLVVRNISACNACISCKNFVKFSLVTTELTGLNCKHQVCRSQKTGVLYGISLYLTALIFTFFPPYESTLCADDGCVTLFPIC